MHSFKISNFVGNVDFSLLLLPFILLIGSGDRHLNVLNNTLDDVVLAASVILTSIIFFTKAKTIHRNIKFIRFEQSNSLHTF